MKHVSVVQSKDKSKYAVAINHAPGFTVLTEGETAEEAVEKYRQSLVSGWQGYTSEDEKHKCQVCGTWTQSYAQIPETLEMFYLCSKHLNDKSVDELFQLSPDFELWVS